VILSKIVIKGLQARNMTHFSMEMCQMCGL